MKYCPQCHRQYSEVWLTFCTDDGSLLQEDLTPAADPNWNPKIRETKVDDASESATQWLPRDPPPGSGWIAPDEREPMARPWEQPSQRGAERPWMPPPPPPQPAYRPAPPPVAIVSLVFGLIGVMFGLVCAIPIPGILAVILGIIALTQIRQAPNPTGRALAIAGIIMGGINLAFFIFSILALLFSIRFG